jgi:nucleotide-binding universal stress UspA family protein
LTELEAGALDELEKIAKDLESRFGNKISIQKKCVCGFALEEIEDHVASQATDLVVMGMKGAGLLEEKLAGSVTTSLIQRAKFPILVIEEHARFKHPEKIVFATDYSPVKNKENFDILKQLAKLYSSRLYILNITDNKQQNPAISQAVEGIKLDHVFEDLDHVFLNEENQDVIEGINHFATTHGMDMVAMIPGEHSFISRMFRETHTKRMAYHSSVPLLILKK